MQRRRYCSRESNSGGVEAIDAAVVGVACALSAPGTGGGAVLTGTDGSARAELLFNPTFPSMLHGLPAHGRISLSTERRPDLVLAWTTPSTRRWVVFDAKYRVGAANLGDAMTSAHIYRDALRWADQGGACAGAWLLSPRRSADADPWFQPAFHVAHGFGALELRPGSPVSPPTAQRLSAILRP